MSAPATWGWKRRMADVLERGHVLAPTVSAYQTVLGARGALASLGHFDDDGLPLPSAQLRVRTGPSFGDLDTFLETGARHALLVRRLLEGQGTALEECAPILDFGCGCGRVARHWHGDDVGLHGCDVNPRMIAWCRENLSAGRFEATELEPPLPYADGTFGLAYAFSVFTHLPEELGAEWADELGRVVRPGAYVLLSTLGESYVQLDRLTEEEQRSFGDGQLVVLFADHAGESFCSAYHPREYVERVLFDGFEYVGYQKGGEAEPHDMHLLRKRQR